jgi:hypothetical protein
MRFLHDTPSFLTLVAGPRRIILLCVLHCNIMNSTASLGRGRSVSGRKAQTRVFGPYVSQT